jgi:hypothetical protein
MRRELLAGNLVAAAPMIRMLRVVFITAALAIALAAGSATQAAALTLPSGFVLTEVASGLSQTIAIAIAPDGRIFVCEKGGRLRLIKNSALLPTPVLTVAVPPPGPSGSNGLLGVALHPQFQSNGLVYIHRTVPGVEGAPAHNRISRYEAIGDIANPSTEMVILELHDESTTGHYGGDMKFGIRAVNSNDAADVLPFATGSSFPMDFEIGPAGGLYFIEWQTDKVFRITHGGWSGTDIGAVSAAGSFTQDGLTFTVRGSGADIWGTADEFFFASQVVSGDFDVSARVASVQNLDPWTKAGLSCGRISRPALLTPPSSPRHRHGRNERGSQHCSGHSARLAAARALGEYLHRVVFGERHHMDATRRRQHRDDR